MLFCRNESGGSGSDERAARDAAVVSGGGEDRAALSFARADHSGLGRGAEQCGGRRPVGDTPGDGQQMAWLLCAAGPGRFWRMRRAAASRDTIGARTSSGFSRLWTRHHRPDMRVGTGLCWPGIWARSPSTRSGGCCARTEFRWNAAAAGASAPILRSPRRPPILSHSIFSRRATRSFGGR